MESTDDDPVIASYDVFLTDSDVSRYVFQYIDRPQELPYNASRGQKPTILRMKPETGIVEVEVPINTHAGYDTAKGMRYGEAMKKSRSARENSFGMASGFSAGSLASNSVGSRVKSEAADLEVFDNTKKMVDPSQLVRTQPLSGRIKPPEEGDPVHMLATIKGRMWRPFTLFRVETWVLSLFYEKSRLMTLDRERSSISLDGSCAAPALQSPYRCHG